MCGLAGFIDPNSAPLVIEAMTGAIHHRGPNDSGRWSDTRCGFAIGHRRLSILDLSPEGHQPMHSASERFVIAFNGEIYNYRDLTSQLKQLGHSFRGGSDTEVMLAAFEQWGVRVALEKFVGMFAFALWDKAARLLYLARDRMGEKPLYYGWNNRAFLFGSELKALTAFPKFQGEIDRGAVSLGLKHSCIPAPWSIYRKIYKLLPGTFLTVRADQWQDEPVDFSPFPEDLGKTFRPERYWSVEAAVTKGLSDPFRGDEEEAAVRLEEVLHEAVGLQMIADVPLGAFLSGGIDSSAIVALMQAQSSRPVRTFSIGFHEKKYDEAVYARAMARHLGTDHTELYVEPRDALNVIPMLPNMFDEPFADSSQIPTYLVSKLCSQQVTVSLSGDGGDELFGGYDRYPRALQIWSALQWLPPKLRYALSKAIFLMPSSTYDRWFKRIQPLLPKRLHFESPGHKAHTLGRVLGYENEQRFYRGIMSHWDDSELVIGNSEKRRTRFDQEQHWPRMPDFLSEMMFLDTVAFMPDDILVKVDRTAMAVSLETRAPFLDHRVVEFAWSLPTKFKLEGTLTKKVLRRLLAHHVPKELIDRPKMGFRLPIDTWLRNDLREWAENLLSVKKLKEQGYLRPEPIRKKWEEHLSGAHDWDQHLWDVLMFQSWLESHLSITEGLQAFEIPIGETSGRTNTVEKL